MNKEDVKYIELKSDYGDSGPAWIARVKYSKSGKTIYFNGKSLKSGKGSGIAGNYFDFETREEYWISGIKKKEWNRHWVGSGKIMIEKSLVDWYTEHIDFDETGFLEIIDDLPPTNIEELSPKEHEKL